VPEQHSPEPWKTGPPADIDGAVMHPILNDNGDIGYIWEPADQHRIITAINFLRDIPIEALKASLRTGLRAFDIFHVEETPDFWKLTTVPATVKLWFPGKTYEPTLIGDP